MADDTTPQCRRIVTLAEARESGLKTYFTGVPCKHGHISDRYVSAMRCRICLSSSTWAKENSKAIASIKKRSRKKHAAANKEYHKKWAEENREQLLALKRRSYERNKESILACQKIWRDLNKSALSARNRDKYERNKIVYLAKTARWRSKNKERDDATHAIWRKANPARMAALQRTRRARKIGSVGRHTHGDVLALFSLQKGKCAHSWCRAPIKGRYDIDHIKPLALGGSNDRRNIQLLCVPCNRKKSAKHPIDYAQQNGLLL